MPAQSHFWGTLPLAASASIFRSDCPTLPLDRFAREDAAWRENCAQPGSVSETQWREYVHLHASSRDGIGRKRVLVIQGMDMP